nr:C2H2-like zinc finger protein [Tanacetum cinerariifolium]
LCDKKYPSGKSLGGHMRSHVLAAANSYESDEKFSSLMMNGSGSGSGIENGNPSTYGLREDPKKTWRAVGSSSTFSFPNERICKQCG